MKKPKIKTKKFLDWVDLKIYLTKQHPELKLDKIVGLLAEYGDFCNGCFRTIEEPGQADYESDIEKLAEVLFEEFPDAADDDGCIELYIWW